MLACRILVIRYATSGFIYQGLMAYYVLFQAYSAWMQGSLQFELAHWPAAIKMFTDAR